MRQADGLSGSLYAVISVFSVIIPEMSVTLVAVGPAFIVPVMMMPLFGYDGVGISGLVSTSG
jgi:hypothetical protein